MSSSQKSVCLLHDNARPHTAAVTRGTLEEMLLEVLRPDLTPSNFYLSGPLKEALERKGFIANDEVKYFVHRRPNEQPQTFLKGYNEAVGEVLTVFRDVGKMCRKIGINFRKKSAIKFLIKVVRFIFELTSYILKIIKRKINLVISMLFVILYGILCKTY
jgi:hypothetical protein